MNTLTQPLRDEHKELIPHIERIREVADAVPESSPDEIRSAVKEVHEFLAHHLVPHAQAEDAALYPVVARALGAPEATRTMVRDHVEVGRYIEELAGLRAALPLADYRPLQRVLYGLYAIIRLHFAKEEEVYLPILEDSLSAEDAAAMFRAMEAAAHDAKHAIHEL